MSLNNKIENNFFFNTENVGNIYFKFETRLEFHLFCNKKTPSIFCHGKAQTFSIRVCLGIRKMLEINENIFQKLPATKNPRHFRQIC